jgi:hypothetical protein
MLWIIYGGQSVRAHAIADKTAVETMCGKAIGENPKEVKGLSASRKCKVCQSVIAANQPWGEKSSDWYSS